MSHAVLDTPPAISPELVAEHGLSTEEYGRLLDILGREPSITELGVFSVMWSEHCSYKSSKKWLATLPTEGPQVIQGPGENAGVVDIGDGLAAVFKIESHNHPSFIEPYQGAATGVGGIMRDVFTMGARPIANLNALRFGDPSHSKTKHLVAGVVSGIGGYGNCIGVPTVGGEVNFHSGYNGNILVNAMTVGIAKTDRIFYSAAAGIGNPVVYVGSKTGRDGIHGATMASAEFADDSEEKRPTVQVGDPFAEKLLLEACLELMETDAIIAIQDMGAAGLTSSSVEMSSKGGVGIELDLDAVPMRETAMSAYEVMLSESQERMLMVLKPDREAEARAIFEKWELDFAVIGRITDTGHLIVRKDNELCADIPVEPLVSQSPIYDRPHEKTKTPAILSANDIPATEPVRRSLMRLLASPDLASRRWIWEQYDYLVRGETVIRPGGDAGIVRIEGADKALALTTDCTPRYCVGDPKTGGRQAVAEAYRNLCAVGARPLAVTNNLNFGSPERRSIMGQFVGCVEGIGEACRALEFPVVSGNVSFYNETNGRGIPPTPVIGGVGLIEDWRKIVGAAPRDDDRLIVIGANEDIKEGWLGASLYLREIAGREDGAPPPVDLETERRNGELVRALIAKDIVSACHDVSDGGLLVALAEMALAGNVGMSLTRLEGDILAHAYWFGEDQGRYIVASSEPGEVLAAAKLAGAKARVIGRTGGDMLTVDGAEPISIMDLRRANESWLPAYMATP